MKSFINQSLVKIMFVFSFALIVTAFIGCGDENKNETSEANNHQTLHAENDCESACEQECDESVPCESKENAVAETNTTEIFNAYCPVKGGEVDPETPTVEWNGKTWGFCCPGCDSTFLADPERYSQNISEDGKEFLGERTM